MGSWNGLGALKSIQSHPAMAGTLGIPSAGLLLQLLMGHKCHQKAFCSYQAIPHFSSHAEVGTGAWCKLSACIWSGRSGKAWGILNTQPSRAVFRTHSLQSSFLPALPHTQKQHSEPSCSREPAHPCRDGISTEMLLVSRATVCLQHRALFFTREQGKNLPISYASGFPTSQPIFTLQRGSKTCIRHPNGVFSRINHQFSSINTHKSG